MQHYLIELALWMLVPFLIGCLVGSIAKRILGKPKVAAATDDSLAEASTAETVAARMVAAAEPQPGHAPMAPRWSGGQVADEAVEATEVVDSGAETTSIAAAATAGIEAGPRMPVGISGPRNGRPDQLQRISGVGTRNEQILHSLGFYHYDQIAAWNDQHIEWIDSYLRFNGRIRRENWVDQCRLLAAGEEEEFFRLYGTGGMAGADGMAHAGERTRQS